MSVQRGGAVAVDEGADEDGDGGTGSSSRWARV